MLQRHAVYAGSRVVFYEEYRSILSDSRGKMSVALTTLGGVGCGALAQLIASPTDLVKVQMQAEGRRLLQGHKPRFKNTREVYKLLYKQSGILGFWRGALPNVQRAAMVTLGDLAMYDYSKRIFMTDLGMKEGFTLHASAAFCAGFMAAVLGTPPDMLKTRLMNQPVGPDGKGKLYKGIIDCINQSVRNEGLFSLYKGFTPMVIRLTPWALVNWITFETIMTFIGGKNF